MNNLLRFIAFVLMVGSAHAQSNLPTCPSAGISFHNCYGVWTDRSGTKYVGEWKNQQYNGQGTLYRSDGLVINQGIWANGNFIRSVPLQQVTPSSALSNNAERDRLNVEVEAERQAEAKKREDDRLFAMKERAEREEAERKRNAPPTVFAMRRALVIGNDNYKYVEKLQNAKEDAKAMSNALKQVGFDVTEKFDLGQKETIASIREFQERINPGDEILFFFAGHGVEIDGKNYLVPTDNLGEGKYVKEDSIDFKMSILETFEKRKAKITIAVIDACRNNPFKSDGRSLSGRGLAPTTAATGQMIIQSAGAGQKALDRLVSDPPETKNGVFTRVFVKEMLKPGIPIFQMVRNVRSEVVSLAQSVGSDQMPSFYDQVNGDFYFKK